MSSDEPLQAGTLLDLKKTWIWLVQRPNRKATCSWSRTAAALVDGLLAALSGDLRPVPRGRPRKFTWAASGSCRLFCPPEVCRWCGSSLEVITANFASTEIAGDHGEIPCPSTRRGAARHGGLSRLRAVFGANKRSSSSPQ